MSLSFKKATKLAARLRLALVGPPGSGKTYTGLALATALGRRVAVVDTERGSASKYADLFDFDVLELDSFHPQKYADALAAAAQAGYDAVLLDSLSHAWVGKGGGLELHDQAVDRQRGQKNTYTAWRDVTPHHNAMVEAIVQAPLHVIATMRAKVEYVQEKDERGKTTVRKVGLAPVQRDGLEYEFDVVGDLDQDNTLVVGKTRCPDLAGAVIRKPGKPLAETLRAWLAGAEPPARAAPPPPPKPAPPAPTANGNGNGKHPPAAPAPGMPADGAELLRRVVAKDTELAAAGKTDSGALVDFVRTELKRSGFAGKIGEAGPLQIVVAAGAVKSFLASLAARDAKWDAPAPAPDVPTLAALIPMAEESLPNFETRLSEELSQYGVGQVEDLTDAQAADLAGRLWAEVCRARAAAQ